MLNERIEEKKDRVKLNAKLIGKDRKKVVIELRDGVPSSDGFLIIVTFIKRSSTFVND